VIQRSSANSQRKAAARAIITKIAAGLKNQQTRKFKTLLGHAATCTSGTSYDELTVRAPAPCSVARP
jgi:hypothetical protein